MVSQVSRFRVVFAAVAALVSIVVLVLGLSVVASAAQTDPPPDSGDDRATSHSGNATDCDDIGVAGEVIAFWDPDEGKDTDNVTFTRGEPDKDQYLDILAVEDGFTVTGIVVKAGPGYNVYIPGAKGLSDTPPWEGLHAPLNKQGEIPEISHWFVCATKTPPSTTTTTTTTTTTDETTTTTTSDETTTTTSESGTTTPAAATTTTSTTPLAVTGFGTGWLIPVGALLLIGGGAMLWLARTRSRA